MKPQHSAEQKDCHKISPTREHKRLLINNLLLWFPKWNGTLQALTSRGVWFEKHEKGYELISAFFYFAHVLSFGLPRKGRN